MSPRPRGSRGLWALTYVHRWLGIAFGLLFLAWFSSGIVMMYARMPAVSAAERLEHAQPLDLSALGVAPVEAAAGRGTVRTVRVGMFRGRPVYRFPGPLSTTVFADSGETLTALSESDALDVARRWSPQDAATARYQRLLARPDQWTLQARQQLPLHEVALGDPDDTHLYVAMRDGEVVMRTTRRERLWAYAGPVLHWLYLPVLRRNGPLWTQVILWCSGLGCVMCVSGLVVGAWRLSRAGSPYAGLLKWHHVLGLAFGVVTLTWTFSGLLSMGPWSFLSNGEITRTQRRALSGEPATGALAELTATRLRDAAAASLGRARIAKQLTLIYFRSEPFWLAEDGTGSWLVAALLPERTLDRFDRAAIEVAARDAMPGVPLSDAVWLFQYDDYYYARRGERPLPVLRVRYADAPGTWLYLDPRRGEIAMLSSARGRLDRWLYHGLHSLDFRSLLARRPLWDGVVILLSAGGIALAATTLMPGWRRLTAQLRRLIRS